MKTKHFFISSLFLFGNLSSYGQNGQAYTASFIGRLGPDTVLIETYTVVNNHLFGKVFTRVPEDYIREFSVHFYPDGSIHEFYESARNPFNSSMPLEGEISYARSMNCAGDTCTYYVSAKGKPENVFKHPAHKMDFIGGWVPFISLMEWNSMRLVKTNKQSISLNMINYQLGVRPIGISYLNKDTVIFGGPFLDYTKIMIDVEGKINSTDGTGTPWNYFVNKHQAIDIDILARRMAKTKGIGDPSPEETIQSNVKNNKIILYYRRPYKRGRKIFGGIVPYDSIWRTGAGSATTISLSNNIKINKTTIPKGVYSLYTIPRLNNWTLIFSRDLETWPTDPNRSKEFAEVIIPVTKTDAIAEQFTIEIKETKRGGVLKFHWDNTMAFAEFQIIEDGPK